MWMDVCGWRWMLSEVGGVWAGGWDLCAGFVVLIKKQQLSELVQRQLAMDLDRNLIELK